MSTVFAPRAPYFALPLTLLGLAGLLSSGCESSGSAPTPDASVETDAGGDAGLVDPYTDAGDDDTQTPLKPDSGIAHELDASMPRDDAGMEPDAQEPEQPWDEGPQPWERVPEDQVREVCKLDPDLLRAADALLDAPWAVIRYGKLCHQSRGDGMKLTSAWSATKTLSALVTGMVAYETRDIPRTGRKTGPLSDMDRVDHWLDTFSYNKDAHIAHVLNMIAHNESLAPGQREMVYDLVGADQINSLSEVLNIAIAQDKERLGGDLDGFVHKFLFERLGMANSQWQDGQAQKVFGLGWMTDIFDMAKVGQLMLRGGVWQGERLLDAEWVYRMTHPAFEDANTGYGYLTWLNAASNYSLALTNVAAEIEGAALPGRCAPVAIYREHPHGLSTALDCNYAAPYSCDQEYDVGVWQAVGMFGQIIQGHPGLDMVVVAMDATPKTNFNGPGILWEALKPAVIAEDPTYRGEEAAFCAAYGENRYAPDLVPDLPPEPAP